MADRTNSDRQDRDKIGDHVTIYRRGVRWYANFQDGQSQHRLSLKTTSKREARRRALRLEVGLQDGTHRRPAKPPPIKTITDAYIAVMRSEGKAKKTLQKVELVVGRVLKVAEQRRARSLVELDLAFIDEYRTDRVDARDAQDPAQ